MVGLELVPVPVPPRREGAFHLAEREAGGGALALALAGSGGADARGARAASGERRANLASEVAGAEEGDGEGHGSCAAARARRPSMAAGRCSVPRVACRADEGEEGMDFFGRREALPSRWSSDKRRSKVGWALFDKDTGPILWWAESLLPGLFVCLGKARPTCTRTGWESDARRRSMRRETHRIAIGGEGEMGNASASGRADDTADADMDEGFRAGNHVRRASSVGYVRGGGSPPGSPPRPHSPRMFVPQVRSRRLVRPPASSI